MVDCARLNRIEVGYTLLELLCVIAIITVLATLSLGPASRALQRVRADRWCEDADRLLQSTVAILHHHFQGKQDFRLVTLKQIEAEGLLPAAELRFLQDRRVTFIPFAGSDPDDKVVIRVELKRGVFSEAGFLTETKEAITRIPH